MGEKMQIEHWEGQLKSKDGLELYAQSWRLPETPKASVALIHGLAEHCGRYEHVAAHLNAHGFNVHAIDLRGHGKSGGARAFIKKFEEFLWDVDALLAHIQEKDGDAPLFFVGHSMGALVSTIYAMRRAPKVEGLVLSAPALKAGDDINAVTILIARILGKFLPGLPLQKLNNHSISRDPKVYEDYDTDPLNYRGGVRAGIGAAMLNAFDEVERTGPQFKYPLLILQGSDDKLINPLGGKSFFERAGSEQKIFKNYEGLYHEVFNEPEQEQVLADMTEWLEAQLS